MKKVDQTLKTNVTFAFKIEGMDCVEEVSVLKRELSPLVGGEEHLVFDLLNGKLSVKNSSAQPSDVAAAIAKTGMTSVPWGIKKDETVGPVKRNIKLLLTLAGLFFLVLALVVHWIIHGGIQHVFLGGEGAGKHQFPVASMALYSISILFSGWFVFPKALASLKRLRPDMNLLMVIAVLGAVAIGEWFEAATVTVLFSISLLLESWSVERARKATKALLDLAPNNARVLIGGLEKIISANEVKVDDVFVVKAGERFPLDGEILKGSSEANQAPITGESLPVQKKVGDQVFAGTINGNGALEIRCEKSSDHSTLSNIIKLVSEAHSQRAVSEQWVEKFAKIYTPTVMGIAFVLLIAPPLFFSGTWSEWLYRSLVLLVIACPCALVISTPVSIVAALTASARNGVLIKGGKFVELPARLKAIAFDKTGTITKGDLSVKKIVPLSGHSESELLKIASAIEVRSEHPIAKAIVRYAELGGIKPVAAEHYVTVQGKGATAAINGENYWLGSHRYLEEKGEENIEVHKRLGELTKSGHTVVVVGNDTHVCGYIALSDTIKGECKQVVNQLHSLGIKHTAMLTGDNCGTAEKISSEAGLDHFFCELLPQDKVSKVEELVLKYGAVAMVGDGVNDAPAMARSTLGIAMGVAGSDAAIESADIALMTDDLRKIPWLISHSKRTISIIGQNITFSLSIKLAFLVLTFVGHSSLWTAIIADTGASLIVIANSLRLLKVEV